MSPPIHILLPVLNEQIRLKEFTDYFLDELIPNYPNLELWIITTQREVVEYPRSKTIQLAQALSQGHANIHDIHYPHTNGIMAHQLNYALDIIPDSGLVAIYNADSRPEPKTFQWVAGHHEEAPEIFQQYGIYTRNLAYISGRYMGRVLISNAHWQSRWAIGFEYYRAILAIARKKWPKALRPFNYCIGHGLFVTSSFIKQVRFSENTTNEDAIFGLEAANRGISIQPIPYFDFSESPDSIRSIYEQKSSWFQGPFQASTYYYMLKKHNGNNALLAVNCGKLFSHAIYWVFGPVLIAINVVLSIIASLYVSPVLIFHSLSALVFLTFPAIAIKRTLIRLNIQECHEATKDVPPVSPLALLTGSLPAYIIHGVAGIRGVFLSTKLSKGMKRKTIMTQYEER